MKRILVFIVMVFSFSVVFSQEVEIQEEVEFYTKTLNLVSEQRVALSKIMIRKHSDLQQIASLRSENEILFRQKRRSIHRGNEGSIKMLLHPDQMDEWQTYLSNKRKANAAKLVSLKAENADKQDLLDAQYGIEN